MKNKNDGLLLDEVARTTVAPLGPSDLKDVLLVSSIANQEFEKPGSIEKLKTVHSSLSLRSVLRLINVTDEQVTTAFQTTFPQFK
jgi:hypothetical protein